MQIYSKTLLALHKQLIQIFRTIKLVSCIDASKNSEVIQKWREASFAVAFDLVNCINQIS